MYYCSEMYIFGVEEKPHIKWILPSWAFTKWWLSTVMTNRLLAIDNLKWIVHRNTILAKKILYVGLMVYISTPISLVFENVILGYINIHILQLFSLKSIYSYLLANIYWVHAICQVPWICSEQRIQREENLEKWIHRWFHLSYDLYFQIVSFTVSKYPFLFVFHMAVDILMMRILSVGTFWGQCLDPKEGMGPD